MTEAPIVSVIMCTYNGEAYLPAQIESILAQTHTRFELLILDDGSSDRTLDILEEFAVRDHRISVIRNAENLGFLRNFEKGMHLCRGYFIAPADQDDVWLPQKLETLLKTIGEHDMCYADSELMDQDGTPLGVTMSQKRGVYAGNNPLAFLFSNCISGHAMLFRRSLLARALPFPDIEYHDWWLAFVAASCGGIIRVSDVLVKYRQHARAQTQQARSERKARRNRSRSMDRRNRWLAAAASFHSQHQPVVQAFRDAFMVRCTHWLSLTYAALLWRHQEAIYAINGTRGLARLKDIATSAIGQKWRTR